jgi:hypothetical protein
MIARILILVFMTAILLPINAAAETAQNSVDSVTGRLQKAVIDNNIKLDDVTKASIASKCLIAQAYLKDIQDDVPAQIQLRINAYSEIQKELLGIKLRMKRQGADASETDLLTGKLRLALDKFGLQSANYRQALDDIIQVDCQTNPEYFMAGLIVMRAQRTQLLEDSKDLKSILNNSKVNIFDQLKKRLVI